MIGYICESLDYPDVSTYIRNMLLSDIGVHKRFQSQLTSKNNTRLNANCYLIMRIFFLAVSVICAVVALAGPVANGQGLTVDTIEERVSVKSK